jgi:hypothetical protein
MLEDDASQPDASARARKKLEATGITPGEQPGAPADATRIQHAGILPQRASLSFADLSAVQAAGNQPPGLTAKELPVVALGDGSRKIDWAAASGDPKAISHAPRNIDWAVADDAPAPRGNVARRIDWAVAGDAPAPGENVPRRIDWAVSDGPVEIAADHPSGPPQPTDVSPNAAASPAAITVGIGLSSPVKTTFAEPNGTAARVRDDARRDLGDERGRGNTTVIQSQIVALTGPTDAVRVIQDGRVVSGAETAGAWRKIDWAAPNEDFAAVPPILGRDANSGVGGRVTTTPVVVPGPGTIADSSGRQSFSQTFPIGASSGAGSDTILKAQLLVSGSEGLGIRSDTSRTSVDVGRGSATFIQPQIVALNSANDAVIVKQVAPVESGGSPGTLASGVQRRIEWTVANGDSATAPMTPTVKLSVVDTGRLGSSGTGADSALRAAFLTSASAASREPGDDGGRGHITVIQQQIMASSRDLVEDGERGKTVSVQIQPQIIALNDTSDRLRSISEAQAETLAQANRLRTQTYASAVLTTITEAGRPPNLEGNPLPPATIAAAATFGSSSGEAVQLRTASSLAANAPAPFDGRANRNTIDEGERQGSTTIKPQILAMSGVNDVITNPANPLQENRMAPAEKAIPAATISVASGAQIGSSDTNRGGATGTPLASTVNTLSIEGFQTRAPQMSFNRDGQNVSFYAYSPDVSPKAALAAQPGFGANAGVKGNFEGAQLAKSGIMSADVVALPGSSPSGARNAAATQSEPFKAIDVAFGGMTIAKAPAIGADATTQPAAIGGTQIAGILSAHGLKSDSISSPGLEVLAGTRLDSSGKLSMPVSGDATGMTKSMTEIGARPVRGAPFGDDKPTDALTGSQRFPGKVEPGVGLTTTDMVAKGRPMAEAAIKIDADKGVRVDMPISLKGEPGAAIVTAEFSAKSKAFGDFNAKAEGEKGVRVEPPATVGPRAAVAGTEPLRVETPMRITDAIGNKMIDAPDNGVKATKKAETYSDSRGVLEGAQITPKGKKLSDPIEQPNAGASLPVASSTGFVANQNVLVNAQGSLNTGQTGPGLSSANAQDPMNAGTTYGTKNPTGGMASPDDPSTKFILAGGTLPQIEIVGSTKIDSATLTPFSAISSNALIHTIMTSLSDPGVPADSTAEGSRREPILRQDNVDIVAGVPRPKENRADDTWGIVANIGVADRENTSELGQVVSIEHHSQQELDSANSLGQLASTNELSSRREFAEAIPEPIGTASIREESSPQTGVISDTIESIRNEIIAIAADRQNKVVETAPSDRSLQNFLTEILNKAKRRIYKVEKGETSEEIAVKLLNDKRLSGLIRLLNPDLLGEDGEFDIVKLQPDTELILPNMEEVIQYKIHVLHDQLPSYLFESYIKNPDPKIAGEAKEFRSQYSCRLGDTLISVAKRHPALGDESLWKLVAKVNNLSRQQDHQGKPIVRLKRRQILQIPSVREIEVFIRKQSAKSDNGHTKTLISTPLRPDAQPSQSRRGRQPDETIQYQEATAPISGPISASQVRIVTGDDLGDRADNMSLRLECCLQGKWLPVVHYSVQDGRCQLLIHRLNGSINVISIDLPERSVRELAESDLVANYQTYCAKFLAGDRAI